MASIQLRTLIDNVLVDTSRDMGEQNNAVNQAFARRVAEVQDAKDKLQDNLKKVRYMCSQLSWKCVRFVKGYGDLEIYML